MAAKAVHWDCAHMVRRLLWEFSRDKAQLADINQELKRPNNRLDEADRRIDETCTVLNHLITTLI